MRTTAAWWQATKADPARMEDWLFDQYRGEATASGRIEALRDRFATPKTRAWRVLTVIAAQERTHARWVAELLAARGLEPEVPEVEERYWPEAMAAIMDLETGCGVGAWAETMRLERIEAIAADPEAPLDVRAVFARILPDERFHARAFRALAGPNGLRATRDAHALGRRALGLSA